MPRPNDVGAGIGIFFIQGDKILLMERKGAHRAGYWALPGGWIDREDGNGLETCRKEALEELGVHLIRAQQRGVLFHQEEGLGILNLTLYYRAWEWKGEPQIMEPHKCSALEWVPLSQVGNSGRLLFPGLGEALTREICSSWGNPTYIKR
jgi:8-oxo-dGTP diphosphatase